MGRRKGSKNRGVEVKSKTTLVDFMLWESNLKGSEIADILGIERESYYRKRLRGNFTVDEIAKIAEVTGFNIYITNSTRQANIKELLR